MKKWFQHFNLRAHDFQQRILFEPNQMLFRNTTCLLPTSSSHISSFECTRDFRDPADIFWPLEGKPCMRTVLQRDGAGIPDDFWNYHNCTELALQYFYISKKSIYCLFKPLFWWSLWAANCNLYRYTRIQETGFIKLERQKKFLVWKVARWQLNIGLREQPSHNIAGQRYLPEKIKW